MRRFLTGLFTVLLSLVVIVAGAFWLAKMEKTESVTEETVQPSSAAAVQTEPAPAVPETFPAEQALPTEPEQMGYQTVPQYFQTDYPYIQYGNGTIATSGCSMTCLAMMATYLTGQEYTPDQLAYHFGSYGKNNIERLEYGNAQMQLPNERTENVQEVLQALKTGKVAIAMMDDESVFTDTQHFIVLAGMTEDGKILVNDPFQPNYTASVYLENSFAQGFGEHDILRGFSGAWIYDKAAMGPEPFLYDAEKPRQQANRYAGFELTDEDTYTLACFAWAVARNETEQVQRAVLEVILNRVVSEDFPNTVHDVIWGSELYSFVEKMEAAEPDFPQYRAVDAAMYGPYVLPENVYYFSQWETQGQVWGELGSFVFLYSR